MILPSDATKPSQLGAQALGSVSRGVRIKDAYGRGGQAAKGFLLSSVFLTWVPPNADPTVKIPLYFASSEGVPESMIEK